MSNKIAAALSRPHFLSIISLLACAGFCIAAEPENRASQAPRAAVFLLDDQSGPELETLHGIKPLQFADLEILLNGVLQTRKPVGILQQVVDDDAADNATISLDFQPFSGGEPPKAPADNLPLGELEEASAKFRKERNAWLIAVKSYREELSKKAEAFVRNVANNQTAVATRFDQILAARNGRDFNRSDIAGCVLAANTALGTKGLRFLVVNSDAVDLPAHRKPRTTPFTENELSPEVVIIFVNQSKIPDVSALFKGLPNPTRHADSLKDAMAIVLSLLQEGGVPPAKGNAP